MSLLDLSNPNATAWFSTVIKEEVAMCGSTARVDCGVDSCCVNGYMADYGEYLPFDAKLASGESPFLWHNRYPEAWMQMNRVGLDAAFKYAQNDTGLFFTRGGGAQAPGQAELVWLGDQLPSWDDSDGLKTVLRGMLSAGISGFSLAHSDIGGFDIIKFKLLPVHYDRSEELLIRWMELSAIADAVFRTHPSSSPNTTLQVFSNEALLSNFSFFARVHASLGDYREVLMEEASSHGWPLVRHTGLHYSSTTPRVWNDTSQFMLGSDFIAAPVLDPSCITKIVFLPAEETWLDVWTGLPVESGMITVSAPIGRPPLFLRQGASLAARLAALSLKSLYHLHK